MRRLLLVLVLVLSLTSGPARAAEVPVLAGETVIRADRSGSTLVDVLKPVVQHPGGKESPPHMPEFAGGDFVVVQFLRVNGPLHPFDGRRSLTFFRLGATGVGYVAMGETLPVGRYRVYVASAAPVTVTLRFPEHPGRLELAAADPEAIDIGPLPQSGVPSPGSVAFGRDGELSAEGDLFVYGEVDERAESTVDRMAICHFPGGGPPAGAAAYEPGCPTGRELSLMRVQDTTARGLVGMHPGYEPGRHGLGFNYTHAGTRPAGRAWAAWLPARHGERVFDEGPAPPPPPPAQPPSPRGSVTVGARRARVRRGRISVPLACSSDGPCRGRVAVRGRAKRYSLGAGRRGRVTLRVPGRARRVTLVITAETASGMTQWSQPLRLRRR